MKINTSKYPVNILLAKSFDIKELNSNSLKTAKQFISVSKYQNNMNKAYGFYKPLSKLF